MRFYGRNVGLARGVVFRGSRRSGDDAFPPDLSVRPDRRGRVVKFLSGRRNVKRFVGIAAAEGLAAVFALFWLGGGRVTALRVLFAALVVGVGASAVPAALRLRRVPADWLVRAQGAALLLIGAAAASAFYYDHPGLDRAAAYLRAAFPVLLFMALILVQSVIWVLRRDGRTLRSI